MTNPCQLLMLSNSTLVLELILETGQNSFAWGYSDGHTCLEYSYWVVGNNTE